MTHLMKPIIEQPSIMSAAARCRFLLCDELDARVPMSRRYITGWFSPADHQIMVIFYERRAPIHFEAEVLRCGEVVGRFQDDSLARLQNDLTTRFGGGIGLIHREGSSHR